ncbi:hypothetical protein GQ42DRAFT_123983 [Ramicandelaber brevisporus]|nr:hypothetical protein GQ42DRAFT_123983 [Ramicandelaber brevisporus]
MTEITAENINSIPALSDESNDDFHPCSICLDEYSVGDFMRILPCGHRFHVECIDVWLSRSVTCPNCKMDVRTEEEIMEYSTRCQQIEAEHRTMIAARGAT